MSATWQDLSFERRGSLTAVHRREESVVADTDAAGAFALCDLPNDEFVHLTALSRGYRSSRERLRLAYDDVAEREVALRRCTRESADEECAQRR